MQKGVTGDKMPMRRSMAMRPFEADPPSGEMHRWLIVSAVLIAIVVVVVFILSA